MRRTWEFIEYQLRTMGLFHLAGIAREFDEWIEEMFGDIHTEEWVAYHDKEASEIHRMPVPQKARALLTIMIEPDLNTPCKEAFSGIARSCADCMIAHAHMRCCENRWSRYLVDALLKIHWGIKEVDEYANIPDECAGYSPHSERQSTNEEDEKASVKAGDNA